MRIVGCTEKESFSPLIKSTRDVPSAGATRKEVSSIVENPVETRTNSYLKKYMIPFPVQ